MGITVAKFQRPILREDLVSLVTQRKRKARKFAEYWGKENGAGVRKILNRGEEEECGGS